tara:strand:- start:9355 stop:10419 length:1065 start_codon:yes stop_codon:yes gene_type:complete
MKENFLVSTGGSGGHVIPAITICEHLSKNFNVIISSDKRGLKFFDHKSYETKIIDTPRLGNFLFLPINFFFILFLTIKSLSFLKKRKIKKIFSTGGYMSLPIFLAARLLKLDIYLIEPNHTLGRANNFFLKSCKKIFCYSLNIKNFPKDFKEKIVVISPLVRKNIYNLKMNLSKSRLFTLLIVGGSQGAFFFNDSLKDSILNISKKNSIKVIHQTSENNISLLNDFYTKNKIENKIFSFDENFSNLLSQADLCITRAGASTLAELSILNIPFIAVPLPTSKDNHQLENANFYKDNGCCWILSQNQFKGQIDELLNSIIEKKSDYLEKKENLEKLNYQNSWNNVNQKILDTINEN